MQVRSPVPVEQAIARNIRELRQASDWSQADLARLMAAKGWPWYPQTVQKVEADNRHLRIGELDDLAAIFGVTAAALRGEIDAPGAAEVQAALKRELWQHISDEAADRAKAA